MPRRSIRRTDFDTRVRNMLEIEGKHGIGGLSRLGGGMAAVAGVTSSSIRDGSDDNDTASGLGQLLILSGTGVSVASGGDYLTFDSTVYQYEFSTTSDGVSVVWPSSAVGTIQVEFTWDSYDGGGTIEIEVNGVVPAWGVIAEGTSGQRGCKRRSVHIDENAVVRIKVTQTSGSPQTCSVVAEYSILDPTGDAALPAFGYEALVLSDGPTGYWRLGEASGTTASDSSGNGHHGTYINSPTLGVAALIDDPDTAAQFARTSQQYVDIGDNAAFEFTGTSAFSVEVWLKLTTVPSGALYYQLVHKGQPGGGEGWALFVSPGGTFDFARHDGSAPDVVSGPALSSATNYHVVGSYDGVTMRLYLNGSEVASTASSRSLPATTVPMWIAGQITDGDYFDGVMDEVAVYGRALGSVEILEHYNVGSG